MEYGHSSWYKEDWRGEEASNAASNRFIPVILDYANIK